MITLGMLGYPRSATWVGSTGWHVRAQLRAQFEAMLDAHVEDALINGTGN